MLELFLNKVAGLKPSPLLEKILAQMFCWEHLFNWKYANGYFWTDKFMQNFEMAYTHLLFYFLLNAEEIHSHAIFFPLYP